MKYIALTAFILVSLLHLKDSWTDNAAGRAKTKPFLLLLLLLFYLTGTKERSVFLILALLTSAAGDILLIPKGHGWFTAGGISFMFSHFFFILVYLPKIRFPGLSSVLLLPAALLYYGISWIIIRMVTPTTPKKMLPPMYFYMICNSTMNLFALLQLLTLKNAGAVTAYIGAALFFISDCTLFLVRYYRDGSVVFRKHFTVMLTYLAGEFLITLGVMMIAAA